MNADETYFLPYQEKWIKDESPLKIIEKSRQIGITHAAAFSAVQKVAKKGSRLDVWVSSRDEAQAKLFLADCKGWARLLHLAARDLGEVIVDKENKLSAYVLEFASKLRIYSLSSNPNALAGKRGHLILDEFALHRDQAQLYRVAKPVTAWGGQLEVISTHRGIGTVFHSILDDIKQHGNPMGWSHHRVTLEDAVAQGLVERINARNDRKIPREHYMERMRAECLDEEQWLQEYCCQPADGNSSFITHQMITDCESDDCLKDFEYLENCPNLLYLGFDVARKHDLSVIDVGEMIGDVLWDRLRLELTGMTFTEQERELYRLLALPKMQWACIDASGLGMQMAERAVENYGWLAEAVVFTPQIKEQLAYPLRSAFEDKKLRIPRDPKLRFDLRGIRKEVSESGNICFTGDGGGGHCDRFWAKALRQYAARPQCGVGVSVG